MLTKEQVEFGINNFKLLKIKTKKLLLKRIELKRSILNPQYPGAV